MEQKDFEKAFELISKMFYLKKYMEKIAEVQGLDNSLDNSDDDDDDEDNNDDDDKICQELNDEYESIMKWCFGKKFNGNTQEKLIYKWKDRHPDLPVPRALLVSLCSKTRTLALMLDVIPLYHANKKAD